MNKPLGILLAAATLGLAPSCYYGAYDYGYADSYGYSGGGTSFIYTSSDQWLYDPVVYCYYDRHRGCYYDPWLGGYYPRGYCPTPVYGMPHPYGWNGSGHCPTPRDVHNHQIDRYRDRLALIRERNFQWADNVRARQDAAAATLQANRAQAAANFQYARAVQQDRNERAREDLRERNARLREAYQRNNRGVPQAVPQTIPQTVPQAAARPQPGWQNTGAAPRGGNARAGYNQPVSAVQAQQERNARLREAYSNSRQNQAEAYQRQKEKLQEWNQNRRAR